jgi:formylglycine-generating enzyme required for sulfatase activity
MDLAWLNSIPEPSRSILIGAAGEFLGGLAAEITGRLLDAAGYQARKHFRGEPEQQALTRALAEGLYAAVSQLTDDPDLKAHYLEIFGEWSRREAVAGELSKLIDPRDGAELDLALLREEFEALGYEPDLLGESVEFEAVVARFASAFYDAAARQKELQGRIQIRLLRGIVERAERQVQESIQQTEFQKRLAEALAPDLTDEDRSYLTGLSRKLNHLPLGGLDVRDVEPGSGYREITLRKVYVDLDTTSTVEEELPEGEPVPPEMGLVGTEGRRFRQRAESALEALANRRQMLLLGGPGSGKTTFLRHVALNCADRWLGNPDGDLGALSALGDHLFPLVVTLRRFAPSLDPAAEPHHRELVAHLQNLLNCDQAPPTYWPTVRQRLHDGRAILLLDGYDEVDRERRPLVAGIIQDFLDYFPKTPLLITCRTRAYRAEETPRLSLPAVSLDYLSPQRIQDFASAWYNEMARLDARYDQQWAKQRASALVGAVQTREPLGDMAHTPLLLTMMARVNARKTLPGSRAELYSDVLDQLLWEWEKARGEGQAAESLDDYLRETGKTRTHFLFWLADFTFGQHQAQGARLEVADIPRWELERALREFHGGKYEDQDNWAGRVLRMIGERSGVLWLGDESLTFPHRSFQEYLAAVHVAEKEKATAVAELAPAGDHWHEVILLAAGYLVPLAREDQVLAYVEELLPRRPRSQRDWAMVNLAGETLAVVPEKLLRDSQRGSDLLTCVPRRLVRLLERGALPAVERAAAGVTLGALGDPRFDGLLGLPRDLDRYFVPVPGGHFSVGTTDQEVAEIKAEAEWYRERSRNWDKWLGWEQPAHPVSVADFHMARYPVTNAQYQAFIDGGGYTDVGLAAWWTAGGGAAWRGGHIRRWGPEVGLSDNLPGQWSNRRLNTPNAPVVGVSWFEAVAYCNWLTTKLRDIGFLDEGQVVRLPTEPEWEYAVRGPERRTYPWGNAWHPEALNWAGAGIGAPSAVGAFPAGATPDTGLLDVAGNAWQWCQTRWGDYPYQADRESLASQREGFWYEQRCIRGISWATSDFGWAHCAARYWYFATGRYDVLGFRVVLSRLS